jgi:hypothetical protein
MFVIPSTLVARGLGVPGWPEIYSETLSQKKKKRKKERLAVI